MREHNRSNISCHAENLQTVLGFYFPFTFLVSLHTVIFKCYALKSSVTQTGVCLTFGALLALSCGFKSVSSIWSLCWLWLKLSHWWFTSPWDSTLRFSGVNIKEEKAVLQMRREGWFMEMEIPQPVLERVRKWTLMQLQWCGAALRHTLSTICLITSDSSGFHTLL